MTGHGGFPYSRALGNFPERKSCESKARHILIAHHFDHHPDRFAAADFMEGCLGLVTQVTNCSPGQSGCPVNISSDGFSPAIGYVAPVLSMSTTAAPLTSAQIQTLCNRNISPPPLPTTPLGVPILHPNSIEFDFTQ
jgi:hypothetical protein